MQEIKEEVGDPGSINGENVERRIGVTGRETSWRLGQLDPVSDGEATQVALSECVGLPHMLDRGIPTRGTKAYALPSALRASSR